MKNLIHFSIKCDGEVQAKFKIAETLKRESTKYGVAHFSIEKNDKVKIELLKDASDLEGLKQILPVVVYFPLPLDFNESEAKRFINDHIDNHLS